MSAIFAKAKSKTRNKASVDQQAKADGNRLQTQPTRPKNPQAKAFYSAPPAQILNFPIQTKVAIGRPNDPYEREADAVANRVVAGQPVTSISTLPPGGLSAPAQRQEEPEDEAAQTAPLQRQEEKETGEAAQTALLQRQEEELGDTALTLPLQRQEDDGTEETAQTASVQRQEDKDIEETEETAQTTPVQRQEEEETGDVAQTATLQRQEEEPEDAAQTLSVQRQEAEETEDTAQTAFVQQQEDEGTEETAQTAPVQRQEEEETVETAQTAQLQRQEEESEDTAQTLSVQRQGDEETEETAQSAPVAAQNTPLQRQEEEPEDTAQTLALKRQGDEGTEDTAQTPAVQRQEEEGSEEAVQEMTVQFEREDDAVQERSAGTPEPSATEGMRSTAAHAIHSRGPGEPLNLETRRRLESSQGVDLSEVRVHEDSSARQAAGALKARAFTHKNHIWLGHGQSQTNVRLMAHETTHVLQQGGVVRRKPLEETEEENRSEEESARVTETIEEREGARPEPAVIPPPAPPLEERLEPKPSPPVGTEAVPGAGAVTPEAAEPIKAVTPPGEEEAAIEEKAAGLETKTVEEREAAEEPEAVTSAVPATVEEKEGVPSAAAETAPATTEEAGEAPAAAGVETEAEARPSPEVKKGSEKEPVVTEADKAKVEEKAAEEAPAAPAPEEDPKFQAVMGRLEKHSRREKSHEPATKKVAAARAAAVPPENDRSSRAQANQVEVMDKQEAKKPAKDDFLSMLRKALEAIAPKDMEETEEFKKKGKAGQLKATLNNKVDQQKADSAKDIKSATEAEPDPKTVEPKDVTPIPADPANPPKPNLRSKEILPDPKSDSDISVEHNKQKAEQLMAENDIDEEQLERANEPQFSDALKAKKELDEHADKVPQTYREEEQSYLDKAKGEVATEEKSAKSAMRAKRNRGKSQVKTRQQEAKKKEEAERKKVADQIQSMYQATKKKVDDKLNTLDVDVNKLFDDGEKRARDQFESYVDQRMSRYKWDRYINKIGGSLLWAKDKLFGMPDEVNRFYEEGRDRYIKDMDAVLVKIADTVETRLKEAKDEIAKGKKQIKEYVDALPKNLQKAGKEAENNLSSQFDELEEGVESKKQELAQNMAKRYQESRKKLDERIEELKKENQGLVDAFIGKIKEIIEILRNFKNRVMSLMKQGGDVLRKIVKDPGKFLDNLGAALKKGFNQFTGNFLKHLKAAFINWLFGTMSKAGIEIPSEFSFKGVFGLILQIIGITKDWIRSRVVKLIGAKNVERIEKAWSIVSTFISGGIGGLWDKAKQYLGDLKDKLFDTIQNWLITQIVKQAVIWVLSLLNPVSALLKIIKMIYDVVMFFVENIDRILQLVKAVIQSTAKIMAGNIGAAANWIENAMARILPIIISFLARLLGISGIANKIKSFIKKIQKKVRGVVDKILKKIVKGIKKFIGKAKVFGKKVLRRGKAAAAKGVKKIKELMFPKHTYKTGKETHTIRAKKIRGKYQIVVKSEEKNVYKFAEKAQEIAKDLNEPEKSEANRSIKNLKSEYDKWEKSKAVDKEKKYKNIVRLMIKVAQQTPGQDIPKSDAPRSYPETTSEGIKRAKTAEIGTLTMKDIPKGENTTAKEDIPGIKAPNYEKVSNYRLHLIHHELGGKAESDKGNLVAGSKTTNEGMRSLVEIATLAAVGKRGKQRSKEISKGMPRKLNYKAEVFYDDSKKGKLKYVAKRIKVVSKDKETAAIIGEFDKTNYS